MKAKNRGAYLKKRLKQYTAILLSAILMAQGMVANASFAQQTEPYSEETEAVSGSIDGQGVSTNQLMEEMKELEPGMTEDGKEAENPEESDKATSNVGEDSSNEEPTEESIEEESIEEKSVSENAMDNLEEVQSPFSEDRYNPIYYGEVTDRWPAQNEETGLYAQASGISFEDYILNAINNFEMEVDVRAYNISINDLWTEIYHVLNAHPELFYVTVTSAYTNRNTNTVVSYVLTYIGTADTIEAEKAKFQSEARKALAYVDTVNMSDYEKALAVHDYIILNCEYDEENYNANTLSEEAHTAYGALVKKVAVCDGYAKAYQYIMAELLGIDCQVVTSSSMGHAWSLIKIDGYWYHADLTWDDPVHDCIGRVYHEYFLLSDDEISDYYHAHYDWQVKDENKNDILATKDTFSEWKWTDVYSGMFYQDHNWYYVKASKGIVTDDDLETAEESFFYEISDEGNVAWMSNGCLSRIALYEDRIYFSTPSVIKSINLSGSDEKTELQVTKNEDQFIYGFVIQNGNMKYALRNNTGSAEPQEVCTKDVSKATILSLAAKDYRSLDITLAKIEKLAAASSSGYEVYRKASWELSWTKTAILEGADNTYFRDDGLFDSTQYIYRVRNYQVINGDTCYGPYSGEMSATTMAKQQQQPQQQPAPEKKDTAEKGKVYKVGNYKYKVTTVANGKTGKVTLVAPVKKTLTKVTVPSTVKIKNESYQVTAIEKNAFKYNKKLRSVTIGKYVTKIGSKAFYGCKKLKTISIKSSKIKSVGKNAFKGIVKNAVIKVPRSKLKAYKKMLNKKAVGLPSKVKIKKS